jgi:hypothetical protein
MRRTRLWVGRAMPIQQGNQMAHIRIAVARG